MIGVRLEGRLGNQLFQYAFAYATSKKLKVGFYLDKSVQPILFTKYFTTADKFDKLDRILFTIKGFKNLFSFHLRTSFYKTIKSILNLKDVQILDTESPENEMAKLADQKFFIGFFQSEDYFKPYKEEIMAKFSIKDKYQAAFQHIFQEIPKTSPIVVIHVRRTDYMDLNINLPLSYYHNAIASLTTAHNFYVIISDDPAFTQEEFSYLPNKYISHESEIVDFQFLMNADICILSNSSFSWWGAYLNTKNAEIIVPKYWFGFNDKVEYPANIINESWKTLEI